MRTTWYITILLVIVRKVKKKMHGMIIVDIILLPGPETIIKNDLTKF